MSTEYKLMLPVKPLSSGNPDALPVIKAEFRGMTTAKFGWTDEKSKAQRTMEKVVYACENAEGQPVMITEMFEPAKGENTTRFDLKKGETYLFAVSKYVVTKGIAEASLAGVYPSPAKLKAA